MSLYSTDLLIDVMFAHNVNVVLKNHLENNLMQAGIEPSHPRPTYVRRAPYDHYTLYIQ